MKILALEFSSAQRSVAIGDVEVIETGPRATHALGMIDAVLREARLEREQIERLAIGLGPGSYAGIRAAIAVAQGWQLARNVKLLGISSADVLAAQAQAESLTGHIAVVIDAQRNEFYLASYELTSDAWREIRGLKVATLGEVEMCQQAGQRLIGPEITQRFSAGIERFPRAATLARLAAARTDFVPGEKLEPIYLRETSFLKAPPSRILPA